MFPDEPIVQEGSCDFIVEAPTPALAAAILLAAHNRARKQCSNVVALPDGQRRCIGAMFVVENSGLCRLLDETGQEIEDVGPDLGPDPTGADTQDSTHPKAQP